MEFTSIGQAKKATGLSYLGGINISAKMIKNKKVFNQRTYSLYLAPAKLSGYEVCKFASTFCRKGCLNTSGRAGMEHNMEKKTITNARIKKTRLFFEHKQFFMDWLVAEIQMEKNKAEANGEGFSIRLNCTSDIDWAQVEAKNGYNIFELFPTVDFYDYTKNPAKFINKPNNYHLTFSFSGENWVQCEALLTQGHNIAVVFNLSKKEPLPESFEGYKVVDGDISDYRIADERGVIIGLIWKNIGDKEQNRKSKVSPFVIQKHQIVNGINSKVAVASPS